MSLPCGHPNEWARTRYPRRSTAANQLCQNTSARTSGWFERYGGGAVFFGRLVPGVRSLVSVPAGIERMPLWHFTVYTLGGSFLWNMVLVGLGWILGDQWALVRQYAQMIQYALLAAVVGTIAWFLWRRLGRRQ
jgi:membrane protein DedA with SNARE-associated domain